MLLDRIYRKVKKFVNTDVYGNVEPTDLEAFVHDAIQDRNEEYFYDQNRLSNRQNRGLIVGGLSNISNKYQEKILHYIKELDLVVDNGLVSIPEDARYIDIPETSEGIAYEFCKDRRTFNILKRTAIASYPIFYMYGNNIRFYPFSGTETIPLSYLRTINYPKWTYTVVDGAELFNPDSPDFVDADIHPSEENEIVRRVLLRFGINLKTEDIVAYATGEEKAEFNENNAG